uniref:Major facilitator superfamily (MFS) profile domain-containing protein n=1 Tax=Ditylenchus dipsaci TaxID=166011 RepID=A0A915D6B3_9BILA
MVDETCWKSIYVVTLICLFDAIRMSTIGSSAWPYLNIMDADATEEFFGYSKSISSMGNIAAVAVSGYVSNKLLNTSPLMIIGKIFALMACVLYVSINLFPMAPRYIFLSADVLFGISTVILQ